jgi:hypothetical protein
VKDRDISSLTLTARGEALADAKDEPAASVDVNSTLAGLMRRMRRL